MKLPIIRLLAVAFISFVCTAAQATPLTTFEIQGSGTAAGGGTWSVSGFFTLPELGPFGGGGCSTVDPADVAFTFSGFNKFGGSGTDHFCEVTGTSFLSDTDSLNISFGAPGSGEFCEFDIGQGSGCVLLTSAIGSITEVPVAEPTSLGLFAIALFLLFGIMTRGILPPSSWKQS